MASVHRPAPSRLPPDTLTLTLTPADHAMARYAAGDEAAFAMVHDLLAARIVAFARRLTRNEAEAEDVVQQTFLHIHRARGTFRPGSRVLPWALTIARSVLLQDWRQRRPHLVSHDPCDVAELPMASAGCAVSGPLEAKQLAWLAVDYLERLPERQQSAYRLVKLDGQSHAQAARALGTTPMSVKLRVHRVVVGLRAFVARGGA